MNESLLREKLLSYIEMMKMIMNMYMTFVVDVIEKDNPKKIIKLFFIKMKLIQHLYFIYIHLFSKIILIYNMKDKVTQRLWKK